MNRSAIFKIIALTNFIALFTVFLLYRNGTFDQYVYKNTDNNFTSSNGGVGAKQTADSVKAAYNSFRQKQRMRMSSSKSVVVTDRFYYEPRKPMPKKDSAPVNPTGPEKEMMPRSKIEMIDSSKSGMAAPGNMFVLDSLLKEKEKQKKQQ